MQYLITFLEGVITFISPCLLPMLPVYLLYFAGGGSSGNVKKTLVNAIGFVSGFTAFFVSLGAFASALGGFFSEYKTFINIICGAVVVLFGLNFTGLLKIGFLNSSHKAATDIRPSGFFSAFIFGVVFSVGWTPCVGAFLGSALLLASSEGSVLKGILMLLTYSLGLGVPFVLSALLIDRLRGTFDFIKKHYRVINIVCGSLLIIVGVLMMTGLMGEVLSLL